MSAVAVNDPASTYWRSIVYIESTFSSGAVFTGSGVMVGPNDVLTASHVVYLAQHGGAATSVRIVPAYDPSPYSEPYGAVTSTSYHYFADYDANGTGYLMPGNNGAGLAGSELDVALIDLSTALGSQTGWMTLDPGFVNGTVNVTGYPAVYGRNMMNNTGFAYKTPIDFIVSYNGMELHPGNSGGPVWYETAGGAHVVGVVSTAYWGASLAGTYDQLTSWIAGNDHLIADAGGTPTPTTPPTTPPPPPSTTPPTTPPPPPSTTPPPTPPLDETPTAPSDDGSSGEGQTPPSDTGPQAPADTVTPPSGGDSPPAIPPRATPTPTPPQNGATFRGTDADDRMTGSRGDDTLDGGVGYDIAVYAGNRADYVLTPMPSGLSVSGPDGNDTLVSIERLQFADAWVALDMGAGDAAGDTVRLIGATLDVEGLIPEYVGIGIGLFEMGLSALEVAELVLQTVPYLARAGDVSNEALVDTVYENIVGVRPDAGERDYYVSLLQGSGGEMSQAELVVFAAYREVNEVNINLTGLQQNGVEYA